MVLIKQAYVHFKRIDLFGIDVRLLAQGQQAYRTNIGAIMTLFLFILNESRQKCYFKFQRICASLK
ncbi:unnamed protein product [Paramecium sonneborni]|uniref:Uncharacterized protein n=1 Tax=Paramecium sonneborni TaxID=65129 RepID=A0A8S1M773_9CILI|nr:unnamed protein product [Paramecium sonneborni]